MITTQVSTKIQTRIMDAKTGECVKESPWQSNLVTDNGLNNFAGNNGGSGGNRVGQRAMSQCAIGNGNQPTSIASGATLIASAGTALSATAPFFTARMVGALLKFGAAGSGGVEVYIASVTTNILAVAVTANAIGAQAATVWFVQESVLQTPLFISSTYQTNAGDCQTTTAGNTVTHKRTFVFPAQVAPYTVNEIGYSAVTGGGLTGRIVLGAPDVVATSNFYVVVISMSLAYSPNVPTAVINVGTNLNTAGNLQIEEFSLTTVAANGGNGPTPGQLDPVNGASNINFSTANYTQIANTQLTPNVAGVLWPSSLQMTAANPVVSNPSLGVAVLTWTNLTITSAGETLFGVGLRSVTDSLIVCDIKFTTPQTAPVGTFSLSSVVWTLTFTRTLVNP